MVLLARHRDAVAQQVDGVHAPNSSEEGQMGQPMLRVLKLATRSVHLLCFDSILNTKTKIK